MMARLIDSIPPFPDNVPTADISFVDFDKLSIGDKNEARKVLEAAQGYGFFYMANTHVDYDFMFDLADDTFKLPLEEKMKYEIGSGGRYFGYKMSGSQYVDEKGTPDCSEFYNASKDDILGIGPYAEEPLEHPEVVKERRRELEQFVKSSHQVVTTVLRVLGEQLGLESDLLPSLHRLDRTGGDLARVTHAPAIKSDVISLGEHTGRSPPSRVLCSRLTALQISAR